MDAAVCQVHQERSSGACQRCGTFLCTLCTPLSVCPACLAQASFPGSARLEARGKRAQRLALLSWVGFLVAVFLGGIGATVFEPLALILIAFLPVGMGSGIAALVLHRGTNAPSVQIQARFGLVLNGIVVAALAYIFLG